jgi:hypothetical protein
MQLSGRFDSSPTQMMWIVFGIIRLRRLRRAFHCKTAEPAQIDRTGAGLSVSSVPEDPLACQSL